MKKILIVLLILGTINLMGCYQKSTEHTVEKEISTLTTTADTKANKNNTDSIKATTSDVTQLGYVKNLFEESGSKYISIQYVQWLSGEEAIKAIMKDDKCTREEAQSKYTNDYYLRYTNKDITKVKVSNNATYSLIKIGTEATKSNFDEVKKQLGQTTQGILCYVTIINNEVTDLEQKYQP